MDNHVAPRSLCELRECFEPQLARVVGIYEDEGKRFLRNCCENFVDSLVAVAIENPGAPDVSRSGPQGFVVLSVGFAEDEVAELCSLVFPSDRRTSRHMAAAANDGSTRTREQVYERCAARV